MTSLDPQLAQAAQLIRAGKLVAFPTETVYGLGANAWDAAAVENIFKLKGRPATSPLIVHVDSIAMARTLVTEWPPVATRLAEAFWPGPLTLILPKSARVPDRVTAGLPSVGVRVPSHPLALALIQAAQCPIAAPSANRFTQLSPTTAPHVRDAFPEGIDLILDGGPTQVGIESTVLSLTGPIPTLLRPGMVTRTQIEDLIGPIRVQAQAQSGAHAAPGQHPQHYQPKTRLWINATPPRMPQGKGVWLHLSSNTCAVAENVSMTANPADYARQLYAVLHDLDSRGYDWIAVERPPETIEWAGVLDRLTHAACAGESIELGSSIAMQYTRYFEEQVIRKRPYP